MAETTNYGLYITETADNPSFEDWRNALCGSNDSNMQKIDAALANAAPQHLIVTITGDDTNGYTADKTVDEIESAYNAGKLVLAKHLRTIYYLSMMGGHCLFCYMYSGGVMYIRIQKDGQVSKTSITIPSVVGSAGDFVVVGSDGKTMTTAPKITGNAGDFVIIGEDGNLTAITIPLAEDGVV